MNIIFVRREGGFYKVVRSEDGAIIGQFKTFSRAEDYAERYDIYNPLFNI